jgi:cytochrome P450
VVRGQLLATLPAWYVTRYEEVMTVLGDRRFVSNIASVPGFAGIDARKEMAEKMGIPPEEFPYLANSMLGQDPPDHGRLRKLVTRGFTVRRVTEMRPRIEAIAERLIDAFDLTAPQVDVHQAYAYPLPLTVICGMLGIPESDHADWHSWCSGMTMEPGRMAESLHGMIEGVRDLVARRRVSPADDLITALINAEEEDSDRLSTDELITFVLTMMTAGHEPSAGMLGNSIVELLTHPDQRALLEQHPELWKTGVDELIRRCGPTLASVPRYAAVDVELGGELIKAGDLVQPLLMAANYDRRQYTDPDRFDVTRRMTSAGHGHLGFGHGIHYCLGASLAKLQLDVALPVLLRRFPHVALAVEPADVPWLMVPGLRRLAALPVVLGPPAR